MADHGTVEYATANGNDYPAHEHSYERFVQFTFAGLLYVVTILFALATGGVLGHWLLALAIFIIGVLGVVPSLVSSTKAPIGVAFVLSALIFAVTALS